MATAVMATLTAVTFPAPNLCKRLSLKRLDMIVPTQVSIDIVPANDTCTLISVCSTGHIDFQVCHPFHVSVFFSKISTTLIIEIRQAKLARD